MVNYYSKRLEEDPFSEPSLIDPGEADQESEVKLVTSDMVKRESIEGFADEHVRDLRGTIDNHSGVLRTTFAAVPSADVPPLRINVNRDARLARVSSLNYSSDRRDFLQ